MQIVFYKRITNYFTNSYNIIHGTNPEPNEKNKYFIIAYMA